MCETNCQMPIIYALAGNWSGGQNGVVIAQKYCIILSLYISKVVIGKIKLMEALYEWYFQSNNDYKFVIPVKAKYIFTNPYVNTILILYIR